MKRLKYLGLLVSLVGILGFAACNNDNGGDSTTDDNKTEQAANEYRTTVKLPDGKPATGVQVQWCSSENCFSPVTVDENGMASYLYKNTTELLDELYIHLNRLPEGYTYNPNGHTATPEDRNLEVILMPLTEFSSGDGTVDNEYVLPSLGNYSVSFSRELTTKMLYFSYTPSETGTFKIESLCVTVVPTNYINPAIGYFESAEDKTALAKATADDNSGEGDNFKITTVEFTAGQEIVFLIRLNTPTSGGTTTYPAEVTFTISK